MKFGVAIFPTDAPPDPGEIARMAEDRGFDRLLFPEHTHIPASRESPYPGGGELPREYSHTYDPFVAWPLRRPRPRACRSGPGSAW